VGPDVTTLTGIRVLLVDDERRSLEIMQDHLEEAGATVVAVTTVRAAFEALVYFTPQVILSDLRMPQEDGLAFVRELRLVPSLRGVPVLAVTGYHEFYDRRDLLDVGFIGVMRKPLNYPHLVQTVGALAQARKISGGGRA
jgi:CheY-like chemotaxis protein